jgi:L-arabinonolactonase
MDDRLTEHTAALFRIDPDLSVHRVLSEVGISNCFIWSLENDGFYFADSLDKVVYRFDYDHATGAVGDRRVFADMSREEGTPDGGTIDEEGYLWISHWDGWRVIRFAPDGAIDRIVELPIQKPTSCMFGGPDLRTLYVTSAIWDLTPDKLEKQPKAGGLFALDVGVRGVPEPRFAG